MRGAALTLMALSMGTLWSLSAASAHYCRFKKGDEKNICLAQKEESAYFCRYVRDSQQKSYCLAWVLGNSARCAALSDPTFKAQCEAEATQRDAQLKQEAETRAAKAAAQKAAAQTGGQQPAQQPTQQPAQQPTTSP